MTDIAERCISLGQVLEEQWLLDAGHEIERLRALLNNMLTDMQCMHWHEDIRAELGE